MPFDLDAQMAAEDRAFIVGGETFVVQRVAPSVMEAISTLEADFQKRLEAAEGGKVWTVIAESSSESIKLLIDDGNGAVERWDALIAKGDVSYYALMELSRRVVEMATGLPTMPPAPSGRSGGTGAVKSKAE